MEGDSHFHSVAVSYIEFSPLLLSIKLSVAVGLVAFLLIPLNDWSGRSEFTLSP